MLKAVGNIDENAEISLEQPMCCGVGACFACVIKLKDDNDDGWRFARSCMEGPVFKAHKVWWD
jgi:dihydroorotate dehydrogenase electron transfer subunit